jgi:hypothetical protein
VQVLLYHKVSKSYYTFMEAVCHNHTSFLVRQNHDTFVRVLQSLQLGIKNIDVTTSSQCAMAIDNLATWLHANLIKVDDLHKVHPAAQVLSHSILTLLLTVPFTCNCDFRFRRVFCY